MNQLYISAAHKSSGKTTVTLGICSALNSDGMNIQPFKKGPDYIDPLWLSQATGNACYNLDFFTSSNKQIKELFHEKSASADLSIIEGNKGLYDGLDLRGGDSNAAMADLLGSSVVLVINTVGITRGVAPLLLGYLNFDGAPDIRAVILNNTAGSRHESKLVAVVNEYTDLEVLGTVRRDSDLLIDERHLGLVPSNEKSESDKVINAISQRIRDQVDLQKLVALASPVAEITDESGQTLLQSFSESPRLGIFKDAAFGFYYPDDLEKFVQNGVELVEINALQDTVLPQIDALFIGGGFPETHMESLAENASLMRSVKAFIENDGIAYAECGGLMYLSRSLTWKEKKCKMCEVIPADVVMHDKPQGRGYIKLTETDQMIWPGEPSAEVIHAHEFHYSSLENLPDDARFAYQVIRGHGINGKYDGFIYKNLIANYTHMRNTGFNNWIERFLAFIAANK
jgi:cobyrinic acid a,c-diamide synthase